MASALKWLGVAVAAYVGFVVAFEAGFLGYMQPTLENTRIPTLVLVTRDEDGATHRSRLASLETGGALYVSAHHWTRGWYHRARRDPHVIVEKDGSRGEYLAVPVTGQEYDRVVHTFPLPFVARFLMGFPVRRDILRLDPVGPSNQTR